jgi:hypothetical protein
LAPDPSWNTNPVFGNAGSVRQAGKLLAMIGGIRHGIKYTSPVAILRAGLVMRGEETMDHPAARAILGQTGANRSRHFRIKLSWFRWVRFRFSDGSHARLVGTLTD